MRDALGGVPAGDRSENARRRPTAAARWWCWVLLIFSLLFAPFHPAASAQAPFPTDFSDWHLPLPAGDWVVTRGPCGVGQFHHQCGYYEDHCAVDLTSALGSMEGVPVLAPQDGRVFFMGTRADSGLALMLEHADGRISAMLHLSKIVVAPDQRVTRGEVIAYAGNTGSSGRAHLHFHVQPNAVERECVPLVGLDEINPQKAVAWSKNLPWSALTLVEPPVGLPDWLPLTEPGSGLPHGLVMPPLGRAQVPLVLPAAQVASADAFYAGRRLTPTAQTTALSIFSLPLVAPRSVGEYQRLVVLRPRSGGTSTTLSLSVAVRPAVDASAGEDIVYISPTFDGPANYSQHSSVPRLCWTVPLSAGQPPLTFRAMIVGPGAADSGWITDSCWQPPRLPAGLYHWKVFVRDGAGYMNRTNQRPFVFRIR